MVATLSKIGEGAFADVYGCQGDDWRKLALKVKYSIFMVLAEWVNLIRSCPWVETSNTMMKSKTRSNLYNPRQSSPCESHDSHMIFTRPFV